MRCIPIPVILGNHSFISSWLISSPEFLSEQAHKLRKEFCPIYNEIIWGYDPETSDRIEGSLFSPTTHLNIIVWTRKTFVYIHIYIHLCDNSETCLVTCEPSPKLRKVMRAGSCKTHSSPQERHLHETLTLANLLNKPVSDACCMPRSELSPLLSREWRIC